MNDTTRNAITWAALLPFVVGSAGCASPVTIPPTAKKGMTENGIPRNTHTIEQQVSQPSGSGQTGNSSQDSISYQQLVKLYDDAFTKIEHKMDSMVNQINAYIDSTGHLPSITEGNPDYKTRILDFQNQLQILYEIGTKRGIIPKKLDASNGGREYNWVTGSNATKGLLETLNSGDLTLYKSDGFYVPPEKSGRK